ncbi:hypothetical protein ATO11_19190 [Pseudaestuariivita atlantica]|uniref:Phytanoyl-CoA dioxygenase n=2 Tax=Pseudaestuariivita atlantica TaxID=1317121 RepID=A0A0L1JJZ9_9RHOB|nr:hypothetical protein ATO11_19190 [Pseudaestuariivita atlantica]
MAWVDAARPVAEAAVADPANAHWLQCEGTWFVGVDALPNDTHGAVPGGAPLEAPALDLWRAMGHAVPPLHRAQVSVTYCGYPRPRAGESEGAWRYRLNRDAAHVDGLLPEGPDRRRKLREPHAFILGLPLNPAHPDAAPLVVWEASHHVVARHLRPLFDAHPPEDWPDIDLTDAYHAARKEAFATCARVPVPAGPGECLLLHHLCLHGVAPWTAPDDPAQDARMIAYFRPEWPDGAASWITPG